jgi:Tfp pilus assembly protein PilN
MAGAMDGERDHAKKMEAVQKEVADNQTWHVQKLRTLIAALPKVEGEILEQGDFAFVRYAHADGPLPEIPRCNQIALLQHRQGME